MHGCKNRGLNFYCKNQAGGFINIVSLVVQQAQRYGASGADVLRLTDFRKFEHTASQESLAVKSPPAPSGKPL